MRIVWTILPQIAPIYFGENGQLRDFDFEENYDEGESKASKTITVVDHFHKVVSRVITDARGHSSSDEDNGRFKRHTLR